MQRSSLIAGAAFVAASLLAACGGGGGGTPGSGTPPTAAPTTAPTTSNVTEVLVTTLASGNQGPGFTLYTLSDDTTSALACTVANGCTGLWIPYSAGATAADETATGLTSGISVFSRSDNHALQWAMSVNGVVHPLYTYAGDSAAGAANGIGIVSFGGTWEDQAAPAAGSATISGEPAAGALSAPAPTSTPAPGGYSTNRP